MPASSREIPPAAREVLSSVERSSENNAGYHLLLARSYLLADDKEKALAEVNRGVALSPDDPLVPAEPGAVLPEIR